MIGFRLSAVALSSALLISLTACADKPSVEDAGYATASFMSIANFKALNVLYAMGDPTISASQQHSSCLFNIDREVAIPVYQNYLKKHLTEEELKAADEFYSSELGARIEEVNESRIDEMAAALTEGQTPQEIAASSLVATQPSEEDKIALKEFLATSVGKKMSDLTRGDTYHKDGFANYTYLLMTDEYNDCNVELEPVEVLTQMIEQSDKSNYE